MTCNAWENPVTAAAGEAPWRQLAPLRAGALTLYMDVTNKCNLQCRMCYFSFESIFTRPADYMPEERFSAVARRLFPFAHTVYLSASCEPLLHPRFDRILRAAGRHAPRNLKFLTNGQLLTGTLCRAAVESGITEIHVSTDGATPRTYEWMRRGGSFDRLFTNLRRLAEVKRELGSRLPVVQFNITLMRSNVEELGEFARLARELEVERLACRHLIPYDGLDMERESLAVDRDWANRQMERGLRDIARHGVSVVVFPDFFQGPGRSTPPWHGFIQESAVIGSSVVPPAAARDAWSWLPARLRWRWHARALHRWPRHVDDRPMGSIDEPAPAVIPARDGLLLAGWALYRRGVARITVGRELRAGEAAEGADALGLAPLGEAVRHNGTRPDVAARFPDHDEKHAAGWTFRLPVRRLPESPDGVRLHVLAWGRDGRRALLGTRTLAAVSGPELGAVYCRRPFDCLYVDSAGRLFPHPDCRTGAPFDMLDEQRTLEQIWHGTQFDDLRRRVLTVDPPEMCRGCPDFINRNVNDPDYFATRAVK